MCELNLGERCSGLDALMRVQKVTQCARTSGQSAEISKLRHSARGTLGRLTAVAKTRSFRQQTDKNDFVVFNITSRQ